MSVPSSSTYFLWFSEFSYMCSVQYIWKFTLIVRLQLHLRHNFQMWTLSMSALCKVLPAQPNCSKFQRWSSPKLVTWPSSTQWCTSWARTQPPLDTLKLHRPWISKYKNILSIQTTSIKNLHVFIQLFFNIILQCHFKTQNQFKAIEFKDKIEYGLQNEWK